MELAALASFVGIAIAAATSAWLVPLYFRERRAAIERAEGFRALVVESRAGVVADVRAMLAELVPAAARARHFDDPEAARAARAAREDAEDAAAVTEVHLLTKATEVLGETVGPAAIEWAKLYAPGPWKRALKNPALAERIMTPVLGLAQRALQNAKKGGEGRSDMR